MTKFIVNPHRLANPLPAATISRLGSLRFLDVRCVDCLRYQNKPRARMPPSSLVLGDKAGCTYSGERITPIRAETHLIDCSFYIPKEYRAVGRPDLKRATPMRARHQFMVSLSRLRAYSPAQGN